MMTEASTMTHRTLYNYYHIIIIIILFSQQPHHYPLVKSNLISCTNLMNKETHGIVCLTVAMYTVAISITNST